jgi:hypothetical protein
MVQDKSQDLGYCLTSARVEVEKAMIYLHQCLELTKSADKTINQLLSDENLIGYSALANMVVLQGIKEDLKDLESNI